VIFDNENPHGAAMFIARPLEASNGVAEGVSVCRVRRAVRAPLFHGEIAPALKSFPQREIIASHPQIPIRAVKAAAFSGLESGRDIEGIFDSHLKRQT
jgi:hypothetical protein